MSHSSIGTRLRRQTCFSECLASGYPAGAKVGSEEFEERQRYWDNIPFGMEGFMGAARFPEQIVQRREEGLRAIEADRRIDPEIEKLRAKPVERKVKPEENNRRRELSAAARMSARTFARRLAIERQLKAVRHKIDTLRSSDPATRTTAINNEIGLLRLQARRLREMLPVKAPNKKRPKRSRKARSKKPMRA